jgi:hypothetical protein
LEGSGGGKFSDDTFEPLSAVTKLFLVVFALVGIPLMLIYLGQCVKAVRAVTDDNGWGEWICALFFAVVALVVTAISLDITETNREDVVCRKCGCCGNFHLISGLKPPKIQYSGLNLKIQFFSLLNAF